MCPAWQQSMKTRLRSVDMQGPPRQSPWPHPLSTYRYEYVHGYICAGDEEGKGVALTYDCRLPRPNIKRDKG